MATSSITKTFIVSGNEQVELFAEVVEKSANYNYRPEKVKLVQIQDDDTMEVFLDRRKQLHG